MASTLEDALAQQAQAQDLRIVYARLLKSWQDRKAQPGELLTIGPDELDAGWVQSTGLQAPTLITRDSSYRDQLQDIIPPGQGPVNLDALVRLLQPGGGDGAAGPSDVRWRSRTQDKEVQTLDISRQAPGPRWTVQQWCLYWHDRRVEPFTDADHDGWLAGLGAAGLMQSSQRGGGGGGPGGGASRAARQCSDVIAHISQGGSEGGEGQGIGDEDDEADSAFVHKGAVDQFITQSAPRQGILDSNKRRLISMTCLNLSDTPLGPRLALPAALGQVDLLNILHLPAVASAFPYRHYMSCHPKGAVINFTLERTGATLWSHVLTGQMLVVLVPPTASNLAAYATWSVKGPRTAGMLLSDACEGCVSIQIGPGESVIIPGGWPHCIAALEDTLVVGAQMLHLNNLRLQLVSWEVEELLAGNARALRHTGFPSFKHLMWHTALYYARVLRVATGLSKHPKARVTSSKDPLGVTPTPTLSHSQAMVQRRPAPGMRTDSTSAWAAASADEGDHAMSARKRRPPPRDEMDVTPDHTHGAGAGPSAARAGASGRRMRSTDESGGGVGGAGAGGSAAAAGAADAGASDADAAQSDLGAQPLRRLKRLKTSTDGPPHQGGPGSSRQGYAVNMDQHAMDVDEHVGEVDDHVLAARPASPAASAGSGRSGPSPAIRRPPSPKPTAANALPSGTIPHQPGPRVKLKVKAAGATAPPVPAQVAQPPPPLSLAKGAAGGPTSPSGGRQGGRQSKAGKAAVEDSDDGDWHPGADSDSGIIEEGFSDGDSEDGNAGFDVPASRRRRSGAGIASRRAAQKPTPQRKEKKKKSKAGKAGKAAGGAAARRAGRDVRGRRGGAAADESDGSFDVDAMSDGSNEDDDFGSDSEGSSEGGAAAAAAAARPTRANRGRRRRTQDSSEELDAEFGSDVQDTDPEDIETVPGRYASGSGDRARRSSRQAAARGLDAAGMEHLAMSRRQQDADAWDTLKERSQMASGRRRVTGGGGGGGDGTAAAGSVRTTAPPPQLQGRATAAAAQWSEDDSDTPALPLLPPPQPTRAATRAAPAAPAARPLRNVKRRTWTEEDVFDSDEPDTEPDSQDMGGSTPASSDTDNNRKKRATGRGRAQQLPSPQHAPTPPAVPGAPGAGIKVKVHLGRGRGAGAAAAAPPVPPPPAAPAAGGPVKLRVKRPAGGVIPQTDGVGDDDEQTISVPVPTHTTTTAPTDSQQQAQPHPDPQGSAFGSPAVQAAVPAQDAASSKPAPAAAEPAPSEAAASAAPGGPGGLVVHGGGGQNGDAGGTENGEPAKEPEATTPRGLVHSPSQLLMPPPPARLPAAATAVAAEAVPAAAAAGPQGLPAPAVDQPAALLAPPSSDAGPGLQGAQSSGGQTGHSVSAVPAAAPAAAVAGGGASGQIPLHGAAHVPAQGAPVHDQPTGTALAGAPSAQPAQPAQPAAAAGGPSRGGGRGGQHGHHAAPSRQRTSVKNISDKAPDANKAQAVAPLISLGDGRARQRVAPSLRGGKAGRGLGAPSHPLTVPGQATGPGPAAPASTAPASTTQPGINLPAPDLQPQPQPDPAAAAAAAKAGTGDNQGSVQPAAGPAETPAGGPGSSVPAPMHPPPHPAHQPAQQQQQQHPGAVTGAIAADVPQGSGGARRSFTPPNLSRASSLDGALVVRPVDSLRAAQAPQPSQGAVLYDSAQPTTDAPAPLPTPAPPHKPPHHAASVLSGMPHIITHVPGSAAPTLPAGMSPHSAVGAFAGSATGVGAFPSSHSLSPWEIVDLPVLLGTLRHWHVESAVYEDLPFSLKDPSALLDQLEEAVGLYCLGSAAKAAQEAVGEGLLPLRLVAQALSWHDAPPSAQPLPPLGAAQAADTSEPPDARAADAAADAGAADRARVKLVWPDMAPLGQASHGLMLLRPKVGFAAAPDLPYEWRGALRAGMQTLPGASPCPSSVIVDMDVGDQVEVVENNDAYLDDATAPSTGAGAGGAHRGPGKEPVAGSVGKRAGPSAGAGGITQRGAVSKKAAQWSKKLQQR